MSPWPGIDLPQRSVLLPPLSDLEALEELYLYKTR